MKIKIIHQKAPVSCGDGAGDFVHLDITHICHIRLSTGVISLFHRRCYVGWLPVNGCLHITDIQQLRSLGKVSIEATYYWQVLLDVSLQRGCVCRGKTNVPLFFPQLFKLNLLRGLHYLSIKTKVFVQVMPHELCKENAEYK